MVKYPRAEKMTPEDQEKLAKMQGEITEEEPASNGAVASRADLLPAVTGFRYAEQHVFGIEKPVRMRSLTGKEFDECKLLDDRFALARVIVDADGNRMISDEEIDAYVEAWDARTYVELLSFFNQHCLPTITIGALVEAQAKN